MKGYQKERASVNGSIEGMDMGPLVELASEGLLALSVQVGLEVLRQMLAVDVTALAGAKGRHNPDRSAYRHGTETTRVVMGGQKVSCVQLTLMSNKFKGWSVKGRVEICGANTTRP